MKNSSSSISLPGILFLIFLVLKLTDNIDWSWWWVTSPLWIPIALVISGVLLLAGVVAILLICGVSLDKIKTKINNLKD